MVRILQCNVLTLGCKRHQPIVFEKATNGRQVSAKPTGFAAVKITYKKFINQLSLKSRMMLPLMAASFFLSVMLGCSHHQPVELTSTQWQQQLNLPSVQYAAQLNQQWDSLIQSDELEWFDQSRQRAVPALYYAPKRSSSPSTNRPTRQPPLCPWPSGRASRMAGSRRTTWWPPRCSPATATSRVA